MDRDNSNCLGTDLTLDSLSFEFDICEYKQYMPYVECTVCPMRGGTESFELRIVICLYNLQ